MLEVVRVKFAFIDDKVRLYIIGKLGDLEGDVLLGEDILDDCENLGVRRRRSRDGNGLTLQRVVINRRIETVGGILNDRHDSAVVVLVDVVDDLLRFGRGDQCLDLRLILVAFLDCDDVDISGCRTFDTQRILDGIQSCVDRVVGVDDGIVIVLQSGRQLSRLNLSKLDVLRVIFDISGGRCDTCVSL